MFVEWRICINGVDLGDKTKTSKDQFGVEMVGISGALGAWAYSSFTSYGVMEKKVNKIPWTPGQVCFICERNRLLYIYISSE
jgi:hypothetical protein